MKEMDYGKDYKYAHSYEGNFVIQDFLPEELREALCFMNPVKTPKRKNSGNIWKRPGGSFINTRNENKLLCVLVFLTNIYICEVKFKKSRISVCLLLTSLVGFAPEKR